MKKPFIGVYHPSIILTYVGVFCSICGMGRLFTTDRSAPSSALNLTMILLVIAGICDLFDGRIARSFDRTEQQKQFGIQLDSLADVISFVAFPVVILLFTSGFSLSSALISCFYTFAGIMRLGWFNVTTEENKGFYQGLPVTFSAMFFPVFYVILKLLDLPYQDLILQALYLLIGVLFILNFRLKKPGFIVSSLFGLMAVATIIILAFF